MKMRNKFIHVFQNESFGRKEAAAASRGAQKTGNQKHKQGPYENGVGQKGWKNDKGSTKMVKDGLFLSALARNDRGDREKL